MKKIVTLTVSAMIALGAASFSLAAESINLIGGSTSIAAVINPVKPHFEKATGITINAVAAGSQVAFQKLDAGEADVATAGHTFEELMGKIKKANVAIKNPADSFNVIKLAEPTNYAVAVNPSNSVSKISKDQIAGIFTGKISNWKEIGGKDAPILCVVSNLSPGTNEAFSKNFLGGKKISVEFLDASNASDLRQNIATNPDAIGFLAEALMDSSVKKVETLQMKSSPIIMLTVGKPSPKVQKLADFIAGEGKQYTK